ncbi:hypothetical protein MC885_007115 [Smutsia gigantea]|nr:hypothetical protein MC885_007115 [Smutsia gigantea]
MFNSSAVATRPLLFDRKLITQRTAGARVGLSPTGRGARRPRRDKEEQRDQENARERPKGKERGEMASQTEFAEALYSLVTSVNSPRWRQPLLTMCVKNARLEKIVASKVPPPILARLAHKRTAFLSST